MKWSSKLNDYNGLPAQDVMLLYTEKQRPVIEITIWMSFVQLTTISGAS